MVSKHLQRDMSKKGLLLRQFVEVNVETIKSKWKNCLEHVCLWKNTDWPSVPVSQQTWSQRPKNIGHVGPRLGRPPGVFLNQCHQGNYQSSACGIMNCLSPSQQYCGRCFFLQPTLPGMQPEWPWNKPRLDYFQSKLRVIFSKSNPRLWQNNFFETTPTKAEDFTKQRIGIQPTKTREWDLCYGSSSIWSSETIEQTAK